MMKSILSYSNNSLKNRILPFLMLFTLLFSLSSGVPHSYAETPSKLQVVFMDVGQADAILVELPDHRNVLIDGGNREDAGTVLAKLKSEGVEKIDFLIATHPHEDHIGGLPEVVSQYPIGQIVMPKVAAQTKIFESLLTSIKEKGLRVTPAKAGAYLIYTADLKLQELAPSSAAYDETNDYSVVLKLTYKNTSFLLTGDAEAPSEMEMLKAGYDLKSDVLKVGHHGGRTSTTGAFLKAVSPKVAVIMVGKANDYGHPHRETLDRLNSIQVLRTDLNGSIRMVSDGTGIKTTQERATTSMSQTRAKVIQLYVTKSGKCYHVEGCQGLSRSKIAIALESAKKKGYKPCSICHPPQ